MRRRGRIRPALILGTALAWLGEPETGLAGGAPDEEPSRRDGSPPDEPLSGESTGRPDLPPFLRDTALSMRLRTHYADVEPVSGVEREAWAAGGWLAYRSGWLLDALRIGATGYASVPVYAPADTGDTLLLAPGKKGYAVLGEAFAALRYRAYVVLKGYRQLIAQPYIDGQDNAMTPNTFEGLTVGGRVGTVEYLGGYLARIKTRNADRFVPMSEAAGARESNRGVAMLGLRLEPLPGLELVLAEQYGVDTFNTAFAQLEHVWPAGGDVRFRLGVQFTDQRAVGDALVAATRVKRWTTRNGSARVAVSWGDLTLKGGASVTAPGNRIQNPWGFYPGYLRLTQQLFDNAGETAWLAGVACDFSNTITRGLSAWADLAWGVGSRDPVTGAHLGDEAEYDLVVTYLPPGVEGLRLRFRGVLYDQQGAQRRGYQVRFIVNWEIPLLRAPD